MGHGPALLPAVGSKEAFRATTATTEVQQHGGQRPAKELLVEVMGHRLVGCKLLARGPRGPGKGRPRPGSLFTCLHRLLSFRTGPKSARPIGIFVSYLTS